MSADGLIAALARLQHDACDIIHCYREDYARQYHPDLSPLGWHLGHCIYTELFWIRGQLLSRFDEVTPLRACYDPTCMEKSTRGAHLPDHDTLCCWAMDAQAESVSLLNDYILRPPTHKTHHQSALMRDHFLLHFLIQHYAQHLETMRIVLTQRHAQNTSGFNVSKPLTSHPPCTHAESLVAGEYRIGSDTEFLPYDNEYPPHTAHLDACKIAKRPVTNGEFLHFMEACGYTTPHHWSVAGWKWRQNTACHHPALWQQDIKRRWFGVATDGGYDLDPEQAVWGLSYFEAQAYAHFVGGRLPHEYEWEAAMQRGILSSVGQVWEWCGNSFHPYPGTLPFRAFPYDGYSLPYFDGQHYVMRGGSRYTETALKRRSFRNYYLADKRHQFSGCRVVWD